MATWRAEFFDDRESTDLSRSAYIEADTENEAAEKAAAQMGNCLRVDLKRVVLRDPHVDPRPKK